MITTRISTTKKLKEWNEDQGLTWIVYDWTLLAIPYWNGVVLVLGGNNARITQCHACKGMIWARLVEFYTSGVWQWIPWYCPRL